VRRRDENGIDFARGDQFGAKKISACWRIPAEEFLVRVADGGQSAAGYGARRDCMCVNLAHIPETDDTQPKILHEAPLTAGLVEQAGYGVNRSCVALPFGRNRRFFGVRS